MADSSEALGGSELLAELSAAEAELVMADGRFTRYLAGDSILTEGASGGRLHVIRSGKVRISRQLPLVGEEALAVLTRGDFFGEVEFLDGAPASADALAHTDCEIFSLPHGELRRLMESHPSLCAKFLWAFGRKLSHRLRETNQRMALFAASRAF